MSTPEQRHELLIRIDERTGHIEEALPTFVTKAEFNPVKRVTYWLLGALGSIGVALVVYALKW